MKSFLEYLKENNGIEGGLPTADMRVSRPGTYTHENEMGLIAQLQKPENKAAIAKVLGEHPEMAEKLKKMLKDALMHNSNLDFYRMGNDTYNQHDKNASDRASKFVGGLQ